MNERYGKHVTAIRLGIAVQWLSAIAAAALDLRLARSLPEPIQSYVVAQLAAPWTTGEIVSGFWAAFSAIASVLAFLRLPRGDLAYLAATLGAVAVAPLVGHQIAISSTAPLYQLTAIANGWVAGLLALGYLDHRERVST